jgi:hypothetical protein
MKALFLILLPVLIFGQITAYNDTLVTKSGKVYVGAITEIKNDAVKISLSDGMNAEIAVKNLTKIIIDGTGDVYNSEWGFKKDAAYYQKYAIDARSGGEKTESVQEKSLKKRYRPGDHEVLMMPTAFTMEKGQSYITDYELFFLNYTYGITSRTHIGLFLPFPISMDVFEYFAIGLKQNYWESEHFAGALFASYMPVQSGIVFGNVFSIGNKYSGAHLGIGGASDFETIEPLYMLGGTINLSDMISLLLEYSNSNEGLNEDFNGFLSIGIRFRSSRMSWEIGGMRPLEETSGLIMIPWLKGTLVFGMKK